MPEILTEYDIPTLGAAIARNHWQFYSIYARQPQVNMYQQNRLGWLSSSIPITYLNHVLLTYLREDELDARLEEIICHYRTLGNQFVWRTWPDTTPSNLGERLLALGFTTRNLAPNMAADLHQLPRWAVPPTLHIERVSSAAALQRWATVIQNVYQTSEQFTRFLVAAFSDAAPNPTASVTHYLGLLAGEPVATATLFLGAGVAGIYRVATLPQCRGQGIGGAVVLAALGAAQAAGYRIATLRSSDMAYSLYQRLGFRDEFRTISYLSPPVKIAHADELKRDGIMPCEQIGQL